MKTINWKNDEEGAPIICLLSHTHANVCACQVSESRWHPRPGFQTGSLSEISTVITSSSSSSSSSSKCHLKERKKERKKPPSSVFPLPHTTLYVPSSSSASSCFVRFSVKLDNSQKKLKFFSKHPISTKSSSSSSRHCRQLFLWVSKSSLLSQLPYLTAKFKQKSGGGGVLNNWGERLAQILCLWFVLQLQRTHYFAQTRFGSGLVIYQLNQIFIRNHSSHSLVVYPWSKPEWTSTTHECTMQDGWMERWMDRWKDRWMDGWIYEWMDGLMNGWIDGWMVSR